MSFMRFAVYCWQVDHLTTVHWEVMEPSQVAAGGSNGGAARGAAGGGGGGGGGGNNRDAEECRSDTLVLLTRRRVTDPAHLLTRHGVGTVVIPGMTPQHLETLRRSLLLCCCILLACTS